MHQPSQRTSDWKLSLRELSAPKVAVYTAIFGLVLTFVVILPAAGLFHVPHPTSQTQTVQGRVLRITDDHLTQSERGAVRHQTIVVSVDGRETTIQRDFAVGDVGNIKVEPGQDVLLGQSPGPQGVTYYITDVVRAFPLWLLITSFVAMVMLVGGWRGFGSLVGMVVSLLVIVRFVIPAILSGGNPLLFSIVGSLVILITTLYLAHGINPKSSVALLGTAAGLLLTGLLAVFFTSFVKLTGLGSEDATTLAVVSGGKIEASGLLLGTIIIGGLGVLTDMAVGQASAVFEISEAGGRFGIGELFRRGMNVGKDHVAAIVNTLVLAYAGASLPLLIILSTQSEPLGNLLNREFMSEEIVRTLVPCIGILAAVPVTTLLAAFAAQRELKPLNQRRFSAKAETTG
jgi:uncharacterized membrane protein